MLNLRLFYWLSNRRDRTLLRLLQRAFPKPCRLLEAGSATGHLSINMARMGYSVTLVDYRRDAIDQAKEAFEKRGLEASFIHADIREVRGEWDGIWGTGILQCYPEEAQAELIRYEAALAPTALHVYPDMHDPAKPWSDNDVLAGVEGCKEYDVDMIPWFAWEKYAHVEKGLIVAKQLNMPYGFLYVIARMRRHPS